METFQVYRHSGKFGVHGPLLALVAAAVVGFPAGFAYAYLVRWIPIVYINVFATIGYGVLFGFLSGWLMKYARVRNTAVASLTGFAAGAIALYFSWNGHIHATFTGAPIFCWPGEIVAGAKQLYAEGSWGIHTGEMVTGIPLAIVWVVEASVIVGGSTLIAFTMIADTPYCEESQCWLDKKKTINTLAPFTDAGQITSFKAGDLSPLIQAKPKVPGASTWTRLTLKHSPQCNIFYTVRVQNIALQRQKNGKVTEKAQDITKDLMVPPSMFELISKFEQFTSTPLPPPAAGPAETAV
jgi:hypothetical protein